MKDRRWVPAVWALMAVIAANGLPGGSAYAKIYKYQDDKGVWHFTDSPMKIPEQFREKPPVKKPEPPPIEPLDNKLEPMPHFPFPPDFPMPINVSISKNGFYPVRMTLAAYAYKGFPFYKTRPAEIKVEPDYQGAFQKYGVLFLGTRKNNRFPLVFDVQEDKTIQLYFDSNQNGNLKDDGGPLKNMGNGLFGTLIQVPLRQLLKDVSFEGNYYAWVYINQELWEKKGYNFYSHTQLKGRVWIEGREYIAFLVDTRNNDADFTNDGISIDVDSNGQIDPDGEYFMPQDLLQLDGNKYEFKVTW